MLSIGRMIYLGTVGIFLASVLSPVIYYCGGKMVARCCGEGWMSWTVAEMCLLRIRS